MFSDLSDKEKQVLDLYIKAHKNKDYYELDFNNDLKHYDSDNSITISLINKKYINGDVKIGVDGFQNVAYDRSINGHILSDKVLGYL